MPLLNRPVHSKETLGDHSFSFASSVWKSNPNNFMCASSLWSSNICLKAHCFCSVHNDLSFYFDHCIHMCMLSLCH